jgi:hypothetical protein
VSSQARRRQKRPQESPRANAEGDRWTRMSRLPATKKATGGGDASPDVDRAGDATSYMGRVMAGRKRHEQPHVSPDVDRGGDASSCMDHLVGTKEAARASACVAPWVRRGRHQQTHASPDVDGGGDGSRTMGRLMKTQEATEADSSVASRAEGGDISTCGRRLHTFDQTCFARRSCTDHMQPASPAIGASTSRYWHAAWRCFA